jgi:sugar-specific transcriptional regulator TrmB
MIKISEEKMSALGLAPMQAKIYLAALELGQATIQALAQKSGVNRSTIYTFIDDLKSREYILEIKRGKRKIYAAAHPDRIFEIEKNRLAALESLMPELMAINNVSSKKPRVTYYEGMQGIREVYADMLRGPKEINAYEDLQHLKEGLSPEIFKWFPKERAKRGIKILSISRDTPMAREFSKKNSTLLRDIKFIKTNDFKTDINIYGDKIALIDLRGDPPFCVLIQNRNLAQTMLMLWVELWEKI